MSASVSRRNTRTGRTTLGKRENPRTAHISGSNACLACGAGLISLTPPGIAAFWRETNLPRWLNTERPSK